MKAADLIVWARTYERKAKAARTAARAEEEREKWAFKHALRDEMYDNEVDRYMKGLLALWYFLGQPFPTITFQDK